MPTRKLSSTVATDTVAGAREAKRKQELAEPAALADETSRLAKERVAAIPKDTLTRPRQVGNVASATIAPSAQSRADSVPPSRADADKPSADRREVAAQTRHSRRVMAARYGRPGRT